MDKCIYGPLMEEWRDVPGFEGFYQLNNYGYLRRKLRSPAYKKRPSYHVLKYAKSNPNKYRKLQLYTRDKYKSIGSNVLVATLFISEKTGNIVNHKNHIPNDDFVLNLEWISQRENLSHGKRRRSSIYTGISWVEKVGKWRAYICPPKEKRIYLGYFENEIDAAIAYYEKFLEFGWENKYLIIPTK